ncbi:ATP-grasp domain-containing protein [Thiobacillus thioparus]|uniref:ATP-grasp domain-containing protein n=1 Tax=Thiobacillus thioparus TaxID=931 RepID=UPI0003683AF3|nr:ATP-grasp domain-containing protein [Thiobacillus thioparus]
MSNVVLITGIGGDISQGVATILRENRPDLYLVGVDIHAQHGGHLFVDHFLLVPQAGDPEYLDTIKEIVRKYSVGMVIPMSEPELTATLPFPELASGVKWITAGQRVVKAGLDKLETMNSLMDLGIPIPWTRPARAGRPIAYPCILKNRTGSGSRAIFTVADDEDADYLVKRYPDAIFQELVGSAEREVTCAVYRRLDGKVSSLLMLRRLTGGFTGWAKIIKDEETTRMCEAIAIGLDLRGSMNVQLRLTDKGPRVFEINPRFSSTVLMRHRLGYTDVLWAIDEAEGKQVVFPEISQDRIMVRVQSAVIID